MSIIDLKSYLTASGKYPDREKHPELTPQLLANASELLRRVNTLLADLGISTVSISSGFRPQSVNAATPGAAKKSLHTICKAVDIADKDGSLAKLVAPRPDLLHKHDLWLESPDNTKGWVHLDCGTRAERPSRIFKP